MHPFFFRKKVTEDNIQSLSTQYPLNVLLDVCIVIVFSHMENYKYSNQVQEQIL